MRIAKDYYQFIKKILERNEEKMKELEKIIQERDIVFTEAMELFKLEPLELMICCDESFIKIISRNGKLVISKSL